MSFLRSGLLAALAGLPLSAAIIPVSGQSSAYLRAGDELQFTFSARSYMSWAADYGAPTMPSRVSFALSSAPEETPWCVAAALESLDGSAVMAFPSVTTGPGYFQSVSYKGSIYSTSGSIQLTPEESSLLFSFNAGAVLTIRNLGSDLTVGLPPHTLAQDLKVSVSGGGLSVGGVVTAVALDQAQVAADNDVVSEVPEPASLAFIASGLTLYSVSVFLGRRSWLRRFR